MESYGLEYWDTLGIRYSPEFTLYRPKGCPKCGGTGYKGRMGIHELLVATDEMKRKIQKREPIEELRKQAHAATGMTTLLQDGIQKVVKGITDFKQVRAVCIKMIELGGRCAAAPQTPPPPRRSEFGSAALLVPIPQTYLSPFICSRALSTAVRARPSLASTPS